MQYKTLLKMNVVKVNEQEDGSKTVTMPFSLFHKLLEGALRSKGEFDEGFYLAANPDVRDAVRTNKLGSATDHYYRAGFFEGRQPKRFRVDEEFYLDKNPDVVDAIKQRKVKTCQFHFETNGFREGRAPYEGFSLF